MLRSIIIACAAGAWCCAQEPQSNAVRDQYNRTYASPDEQPTFNHEPNAFLTTVLRDIKPGKALDVGMGRGATPSGWPSAVGRSRGSISRMSV